MAAFILLFTNGFDAMLTRLMGRKGVMLESQTPVAAVPAGLATGHA